MTDEKLNGIIKALKLCTGIETACKDCPYRASVSPSFSVRCEDTLHKASLEAIEALKAENAALYERLDKVIEPPCKIGDTVYKIVSCCYDCKDDWGDGCRCENLHKSKIVALKVNSIRFDEDGYVLSEDTAGSAGSLSLYCYESNFGKDWFLTPEAAETQLKELQRRTVMKHRIISDTGLGGNAPTLLPNNVELKNEAFWYKFYDSAAKTFKLIDDNGGFDCKLSVAGFDFGIEPTYQYDDLLIIHFCFLLKADCSITRGKAYGVYGTDIRSETWLYSDYKRKSAFTSFIDEWYESIVNELKGVIG